MKIAAMMKDDGCIAQTVAEATKILIVTGEARIPTAKEIVEIGLQEDELWGSHFPKMPNAGFRLAANAP